MAFKKLNPENWDQHDPTSSVFVLVDKNGVSRTPMGGEWARMILEPGLNDCVPRDVIELFEVARATVVYGWFFYPLFAVGCEQLFIVHEAAVIHRCKDVGAPKKAKSFAEKIDWLIGNGFLTESRRVQWTAVRQLRNSAAHKKNQSIFDPTMAVRNVEIAAELINELFLTDKIAPQSECD
ncbi:hypothetical protein KFF05_00445 [bacterium SCSIO 12827]|nr:hypothetical protein KFF05_00445 [bacterium SCSIO 12827]